MVGSILGQEGSDVEVMAAGDNGWVGSRNKNTKEDTHTGKEIEELAGRSVED